MDSSRSRFVLAVAWVWASVIVLLGLVVSVGAVVQGEVDFTVVVLLLVTPVYAGLGLLMVVRQPGNRVAWLMYAVATWIPLQGAAVLRLGDRSVPPDPVVGWDVLAIVFDNTAYFIGLIFPLLLFFYIFPTGRILTRRWTWAGWVAGLITAVALFAEGFAKEVALDDGDWTVPNPIGFLDSSGMDEAAALAAVFGIGLVALAVGAIPAIILRYRRADLIVRTQIKWVVYPLVIMIMTFLAALFLGSILPDWFSEFAFIIAVTTIPVSVTVAISQYQLYEIDRLISRTLAYLLVVAVLGVVYLVGAVWLPTRLLGEQPPLFVAGSTLAVAALFNPLRRRVQHAVNRRFNRSKYQAEIVAEEFAARLREQLTSDQIVDLWTQTVGEAVHPQAAGVWLRET